MEELIKQFQSEIDCELEQIQEIIYGGVTPDYEYDLRKRKRQLEKRRYSFKSFVKFVMENEPKKDNQ